MIFIPSLLEYSTDDLQKKIDLIQTRSDKFYELTNQTELSLHLDFVLPEFAKQRGVKPSLNIRMVLGKIKSSFGNKQMNLSIHLMGSKQDEKEAIELLSNISIPAEYIATIFVSQHTTEEILPSLPFGWIVAKWYDLGSWTNETFKPGQVSLLMTVVAGKSGQKIVLSNKLEALLLIKNNPKHYFLVDGGWSINSNEKAPNLQIITHSSFWKEMR